MKQIEVLFSYTDEVQFHKYQIDRILDGSIVTVILRDVVKSPFCVCSVLSFEDVGATMDSPLIDWRNLFLCSNEYAAAPNYKHMNEAVQNDTKTAATLYLCPAEFEKTKRTLPQDYYIMEFGGGNGNSDIQYIYRKGALTDYFEFEQARYIYESHRVNGVNWSGVLAMFQQPLSFFGDEDKCGFSLQNGCSISNRETSIVTGLLLGYPLESTVKYFSSGIKTFAFGGDSGIREAEKHFENDSEPFSFKRGVTWLKQGSRIFMDGQQEANYYGSM